MKVKQLGVMFMVIVVAVVGINLYCNIRQTAKINEIAAQADTTGAVIFALWLESGEYQERIDTLYARVDRLNKLSAGTAAIVLYYLSPAYDDSVANYYLAIASGE